MAGAPKFQLDSKIVGPLPILDYFLRRLRFDEFLVKHLPPENRKPLPYAGALSTLVRNLVVARVPLYSINEWAADKVPELIGLTPGQVELLTDDRAGRALDRLFDADRQALLTDLVVHMIKEFEISVDELHNDSTTLTFQGEYDKATGKLVRGKPTPAVTHGHNKDHRPDLKQLLWSLTVSADGGIPIHFKVADGNTEDSTTHIEIWGILRILVGSPHFIYVADSKLCSHANLRHIHGEGGKFITIMPRTWKEDELFKAWLQTHRPAWEEVVRVPHRRRKDGHPDIFRAVASPIPQPDGFRVIWYQSTHKMARDAQSRKNAMQSAEKKLAELKARLSGPRSRFRSQAAVAQAVDNILRETKAARWFLYEIQPLEEATFRQVNRGRPGKNTKYKRTVKVRYDLTWNLDQERIEYDARCDGLFPLITNCPEDEVTAKSALEAYKSKQPLVEKRHDLLKNVTDVTPMYLKSISRIDALLFLYYVALLIHALIERTVKQAMDRRKLKAIPLYPEGRACTAPSARRIIELFDNLQRHLLKHGDAIIQRFDPELTPRQLKVLELLGQSPNSFLNR